MFRASCAYRQEVKTVLYSLWYHHTETSEWSKITRITKITKIQFYKYEHIVVKFVCEFFGLRCTVSKITKKERKKQLQSVYCSGIMTASTLTYSLEECGERNGTF